MGNGKTRKQLSETLKMLQFCSSQNLQELVGLHMDLYQAVLW